MPLEALEEIEVSTSLTSAAQGRNGGGSIDIVTRQGTNRYNGTGLYAFQHESMNANEFFLNRAGTAKPEFRRNDLSGAVGGPIRQGRTFFFVAGQQTRFRSGYASNATAATGLPVGLGDVRTPETIARVANDYLRNGAADNAAFAANFLRALRAFPADQQAGLIATFFSNVNTLTFRELTPADIHPVAINILNTTRDGRFLIPSTTGDMPVLRGNGTFGRELLQQQVIPTESNGWSGVVTVQHRATRQQRHAGHVRALDAARRGGVRVGRRLAVADRRQHAGAARRRHQHAHLRLEAAAGSQRRLLRPREHAHLEAPRHLQLDARHPQPARGSRSAAWPR